MAHALVCWIGKTDLDAAAGRLPTGNGPIAQAVQAATYDQVVLLSDYPSQKAHAYVAWLRKRTKTPVSLRSEPLADPTDLEAIYQAASRAVSEVKAQLPPPSVLTFHLSPGTPSMASIWLLLAKSRFKANLIKSSTEKGVQAVDVPFEISADFIPDLLRKQDAELERLTAGLSPEAPEFSEILYRSAEMQRVIAKARRAAVRSIPVLIEGESGTGKEMLARAIHKTSARRDKLLVPVNCGAISPELVESELFGHVRGAFTGASTDRAGFFETANGGTLFLDEIGELPKPAQVKLLRALQENEVTRVGASKPITVDVRIIAATNRNLLEAAASSNFRADLYYRLAVAMLRLPPLRERKGDLSLLIDHFLGEVNAEGQKAESAYEDKTLSAKARNVLLSHPWPGNVRELKNTLVRAAIWSSDKTIDAEEIRDALLPDMARRGDEVLGRPLGEGLDIQEILVTVARHYLERALDEAHGNKTKAAELVGLPSYQTLTNWLERYGVELPRGRGRAKAGRKEG